MQETVGVFIEESAIVEQYGYMHAVRDLNEEFFRLSGRRRVACTKTYGCQQNENDTERIDGMLSEMGFVMSDEPAEADFILLNTCAVRDHAEQKVFGVLGSFAQYKKKNPDLMIAVCGCMAGQSDVKELIRSSYKNVSMLFNPHALYRFPQNLFTLMTKKERVFDTDDQTGHIAEGLPVLRKDSLRAWVSVMYGCNNFCSYCIVPYVRGRERSRDPRDILEEVRKLIASGCIDITLLGQNVNSYRGSGDIADFADLLQAVCDIPGDFTVKFMTSHPKDASEKLIDTIARNPKISRHLHLPFQSGSDRILRIMNRKYTRDRYLSLIRYAREKIPDLSLTSDVIVGFPGETEEDFMDTLSLVKEVGFSGLYTFLYSPRPGTPAASMGCQIDKKTKAERFDRLLSLQNEISENQNKKYLDTDLEVTVFGPSQNREDMWEGRTANDTLVQIKACPDMKPGDRVKVHIVKALNWAIFGEIINT